MAAQYTPMMTHYLEIKKAYPDTLVFYRLGDFYEMFFEDAKTASHELDLVLTGRHGGQEDRVPMCGVPHHAVKSYIQRLIAKGYKVAIVEQLEDPANKEGIIVKRDVIRVVTPGTAIDEIMDEKANNYLASICDYDYGYALAIAEITTGETRLININHDINLLKQTILANDIREVVTGSEFKAVSLKNVVTVSVCEDTQLLPDYQPLYQHIEDVHLLKAIGRLLNYLEATQKRSMQYIDKFELEDNLSYLRMDYSTMQNLELTDASRTNSKAITLWSFLDKCRSAAGSRMLKKWVQKPLRDVNRINQRLDMITYLKKHYIEREDLKEKLSELYDLERLIARVSYGNANGRDILRLQKTLDAVPRIMDFVRKTGIYPEYDAIDTCDELRDKLQNCIVDEPPVSTHMGGIFRDGYNAQLDELRDARKDGQRWIVNLERTERERTGIKNLRVGYNKVFGYYIEVSKGMVPQVKEEWGYQRKQTLTTGERYITEELKEKEDIILHAEERAIRLESELFDELIADIRKYLASLQKLALALAVIDANYALSEISSNNGYIRPSFNDDRVLDIKDGRHPILEKVGTTQYVPNDINMDDRYPIQIITGPNMGGKSTYMRQCALLVILAQMGCYVPAKKASLPIFDAIYTRIGSTDDILAGQSTFMVEMTEANNALKNATRDSLIIFDEIGRGTSTYDGMALAQAMLEFIEATIGAKTMFSTHYHELTSLENSMNGVKNKHVDVYEEDDKITFLYKVKNGKANKSYGIHVASLAKLPEPVIERSRELLKVFENSRRHRNDQTQMVMVETVPKHLKEIEELLNQVQPDNMTPIEALQFVDMLKKKNEKK